MGENYTEYYIYIYTYCHIIIKSSLEIFITFEFNRSIHRQRKSINFQMWFLLIKFPNLRLEIGEKRVETMGWLDYAFQYL